MADEEGTWTDNAVVFKIAAVGQVRMIGENDPTPDGWHPYDGTTLRTAEWPEFARATGVTMPTFTLPAPQRALPGRRFIVKLGARR